MKCEAWLPVSLGRATPKRCPAEGGYHQALGMWLCARCAAYEMDLRALGQDSRRLPVPGCDDCRVRHGRCPDHEGPARSLLCGPPPPGAPASDRAIAPASRPLALWETEA